MGIIIFEYFKDSKIQGCSTRAKHSFSTKMHPTFPTKIGYPLLVDFSHQKPDTWITTSGQWKEPGEVVNYFGVLNKCIISLMFTYMELFIFMNNVRLKYVRLFTKTMF